MSNPQLRGHCQVCGRQHAVVGGFVAKHGYDVQHGYFRGVCPGQHHAPIEVDRAELDGVVASLRNKAEGERLLAQLYRTDERQPAKVRTGRSTYAIVGNRRVGVDETVAWADASAHLQRREVNRLIAEHERDAQHASAAADGLLRVGDAYHGKPLIEVAKPAAPEAIPVGDKRISPARGVLEAFVVDRGRVRWRDARGFGSSMSTRSWRLLAKI